MKILKQSIAAALMSVTLAGPVLAQQGLPPGFTALHDALRLRPDQEQAWQIFQRASAGDPQDAERHRETFARMDRLAAPQRMDLSIQLMRSDLEQLERRGDALKAFYATLSPEQRESFDRETLPPRQ